MRKKNKRQPSVMMLKGKLLPDGRIVPEDYKEPTKEELKKLKVWAKLPEDI